MSSSLLAGLRVVTTALNLPGPAACARLRELGATVEKVEPPAGDPMHAYHPAWYERLHDSIRVHRLDLKEEAGRTAMQALLREADLLVTAQRPSALARLGLGARDQLEGLLAVGAIARVHQQVLAALAQHDLVAVEPATHDDADGGRQVHPPNLIVQLQCGP